MGIKIKQSRKLETNQVLEDRYLKIKGLKISGNRLSIVGDSYLDTEARVEAKPVLSEVMAYDLTEEEVNTIMSIVYSKVKGEYETEDADPEVSKSPKVITPKVGAKEVKGTLDAPDGTRIKCHVLNEDGKVITFGIGEVKSKKWSAKIKTKEVTKEEIVEGEKVDVIDDKRSRILKEGYTVSVIAKEYGKLYSEKVEVTVKAK